MIIKFSSLRWAFKFNFTVDGATGCHSQTCGYTRIKCLLFIWSWNIKQTHYKQMFIEASRNDRKKCSFQSKLTFCQRMASERWECKCSWPVLYSGIQTPNPVQDQLQVRQSLVQPAALPLNATHIVLRARIVTMKIQFQQLLQSA